jgi:hypothetical protein
MFSPHNAEKSDSQFFDLFDDLFGSGGKGEEDEINLPPRLKAIPKAELHSRSARLF